MNDSQAAASRFTRVIFDLAASLTGVQPQGTVVAPSPDREGSKVAVAYAFPAATVIWCPPSLADRLAPLADPAVALDVGTFADRAASLGGSPAGAARHRVLGSGPSAPIANPGQFRWLDPTRPSDLALIETLVSASTEDDLDEAELDLDDLDEHIVVTVDESERVTSYASGRPFDLAPDFDDIAVITHPDHRKKGLGSAVVSEYCRKRQGEGRAMFYSCDVDNHGSNRVADQVGFEVVCDVAAAVFE